LNITVLLFIVLLYSTVVLMLEEDRRGLTVVEAPVIGGELWWVHQLHGKVERTLYLYSTLCTRSEYTW
jgi:hypothetical protein